MLPLMMSITLSQVLNAWRNREQQVKSFRFRWTEEHFQAKGTLELPPDQKQNVAAFPPRDTTYRVKSSCEMDRDMMRYGFSGESLQVYNDGALEHREYVSASDGVVSGHSGRSPTSCAPTPRGSRLMIRSAVTQAPWRSSRSCGSTVR